MKENDTKRQYLPLGALKFRDPLSFPGVYTQNEKGKYVNPMWINNGDFMIYLGVPFGNVL